MRNAGREVLLCFGGTDPQGLTLRVLRALRDRKGDGIGVHVVVGAGMRFKAEVGSVASDAGLPIQIHEDVRELASIMLRCDAGITSAGATLMEMCCLGRPAIVIGQNAAEHRFASYLDGQGAAHYLGTHEEVSDSVIRSALTRCLQDRHAWQAMSRRGQTLIDGNGCQRTVAALQYEFGSQRAEWRGHC